MDYTYHNLNSTVTSEQNEDIQDLSVNFFMKGGAPAAN